MAEIFSPLPGTFYQRPSPDEAVYKSIGDSVAPDDTIGLIEVMKTFIEIKAEVGGVFAGYVAADAASVMVGETLARVE